MKNNSTSLPRTNTPSTAVNAIRLNVRKFSIALLATFLIVGLSSTIMAGNGIVDFLLPFNEPANALTTATNPQDLVAESKLATSQLVQPAEAEIQLTSDDSSANAEVNTELLTDSIPAVKIIADYCVVPGHIRLTASSAERSAVYTWSTGQTGAVIDVDIANLYQVTATFSNGTTATASRKVAQELVVNGDFSDGNTGFYTEYGYAEDIAGNNSELVPEGLYGIGASGQFYHNNFFGREHTTLAQTGNYMIINGSTSTVGSPARQRVIWQQTVPVKHNTDYYFSAWAMNINPGSPAQLQFEVNGVLVGTVADLDVAPKPNSDATVNINNWMRFYSNPTWKSGSSDSAVIRIINLNTEASGNDFGLDDISFSTLSPFITLESEAGTDAQVTCINSPITPIVYSIGSDASGHSITGLPPGVTASFDVPNYLTLSGAATTAGLYTYAITTIGTCNPVTVTGSINIPSAWNIWTGAVSTDWSDAGNWQCNMVPTATTDAMIPASAKRMPALTTASVCRVLQLQASAILDLNGQLFTNYGGIIGAGIFKGTPLSALTINAPGTNSTVRFDQSIPDTSNALNNLVITGANDTVQLGNRLAIYGSLTPQNGILTINDTLVLRSTAKGTARVGVVTGAINYGQAGKVVVQRYFPARRSWRLVTSPLAKVGSIFDAWQNGGKFAVGKGTYISGAGATNPVCANGLDWSPLNNTSLKMGSTLAPVLNTRVNLSKNLADTADNIPYFIFVRGDRDPINTNPALSNNTTLSSAGKLQTGRQTFNVSETAGSVTLIGNPYAAPVDFNKLQLNNLKKRFWVWDPYLNTDQGGYVLVEQISANRYDMIPRSPGGLNHLLESSQAFYVQTEDNGPASITFQEAAKTSSATNLTAFRPTGMVQSFRISLHHLNDNNNTVLLDGVMALFDSGYSKLVDTKDVLKSSNPKEMIALVRDAKTLTLEKRPVPEADDTLFLRLTKTTQRKYRLELEPADMDPLLTAFLEDSYTGVKTVLSVTNSSVYDFTINANAASADANRFRIIFKEATAPLPVTFRNITAKQQDKNIAVTWTVEQEINVSSYEVEKSIDGNNFSKVNTTAATGNSNTAKNYNWLDENAVQGNNYYRVRSVDQDGKYDYTKTVLVKMTNVTSGIDVSPNPPTGNTIGITFKGMATGIYQAKLLNAIGQTMFTTQVKHTAGSSLEQVATGKLAAGVYQLVVINPDHTTTTVKMIIQ